jgi:hypothetical protein
LEQAKIRSWVPTGLKIKKDWAGKDQQQLPGNDWTFRIEKVKRSLELPSWVRMEAEEFMSQGAIARQMPSEDRRPYVCCSTANC